MVVYPFVRSFCDYTLSISIEQKQRLSIQEDIAAEYGRAGTVLSQLWRDAIFFGREKL